LAISSGVFGALGLALSGDGLLIAEQETGIAEVSHACALAIISLVAPELETSVTAVVGDSPLVKELVDPESSVTVITGTSTCSVEVSAGASVSVGGGSSGLAGGRKAPLMSPMPTKKLSGELRDY
jgi:hypothetical protein